MKKTISLLLTLVMLFSVTAGTIQTLADEEETEEVTYEASFNQKEARKMLKLLNNFKASDETWITVDGKKTQLIDVYHKSSRLKNCTQEDIARPLVYNYKLEEAIMQRAAEIKIYYNTNPNPYSQYSDYLDCELGAGFSGKKYRYAKNAFSEIKEGVTEYVVIYDDYVRYHLANPLYKSVAFSRVKVGNMYWWLIGFSEELPSEEDAKETEPLVGKKKITSTVKKSLIETEYDYDIDTLPNNMSIYEGKSVSLPTLKKYVFYGELGISQTINTGYVASNKRVTIKNGKIKGNKAGNVKITPISDELPNDKDLSFTLTVKHRYKLIKHVKASSKKKGKKVYKCKVCGHKKTVILAKLLKAPKNFKVTAGDGCFICTWSKEKKVKNYVVVAKIDNGYTESYVSPKKTKYKGNAISGTTYKVRMRYIKKVKGKTVSSEWTEWQKVTIK